MMAPKENDLQLDLTLANYPSTLKSHVCDLRAWQPARSYNDCNILGYHDSHLCPSQPAPVNGEASRKGHKSQSRDGLLDDRSDLLKALQQISCKIRRNHTMLHLMTQQFFLSQLWS